MLVNYVGKVLLNLKVTHPISQPDFNDTAKTMLAFLYYEEFVKNPI